MWGLQKVVQLDAQPSDPSSGPQAFDPALILPDRDRLFHKLQIAYTLTDAFSGMCPSGCTQCEERESLVLLPYEDEFIHARLAREGQPVPGAFRGTSLRVGRCSVSIGYSPAGGPPCPMMERGTGLCTIYPARPLDCRSFPLVPRFLDDGGLEFHVARYCPIAPGLSPEFIHVARQVWHMLLEDLPAWWRRLYNRDSLRQRKMLVSLTGRSAG